MNLEIVVPANLRYLIGMSFIGTAFFAFKLLISFCTSSGQVGDKKKDVWRFDAGEVFGAARIGLSIWLDSFSPMDEKYLLKKKYIYKY